VVRTHLINIAGLGSESEDAVLTAFVLELGAINEALRQEAMGKEEY